MISSIKNELYFYISTFALINGVDAVNRINVICESINNYGFFFSIKNKKDY